jgi:hypothetical protein
LIERIRAFSGTLGDTALGHFTMVRGGQAGGEPGVQRLDTAAKSGRRGMGELFWWTGAVMWAAISVIATAILLFAAWRAIYATCEVGRQLWKHHVVAGGSAPEWLNPPSVAWAQEFFRGPHRG